MNDSAQSEKVALRAAARVRAERILEQEHFELRIDRLVEGGFGFGRVEGFPVLVPRSAPGDLLRVKVADRKKDYATGEVIEVLEPGPDRAEPPCEVYDRCGGCDLQHIRPDRQTQLKVAAATETLRRIGGLEIEGSSIVVGASLGYRSRAQLQVRGQGNELEIGFFARGSKDLVPTLSCPVLVQGLETRLGHILRSLREESEVIVEERLAVARSSAQSAPEEDNGTVGSDGGHNRNKAAPPVDRPEAGSGPRVLPTRLDLLLGDHDALTTAPVTETLPHRPVIRRVGDFDFELDARCFFQAHESLAERLVEVAVGGFSGETAFELHSGVGLFTLTLAKKYLQVFAVESDRIAVRYLRRNTRRNGIGNVDISPTSAEHFVRDWQSAVQRADAGAGERPPRAQRWFFDPPRTGLSKDLVHAVCRARPERITYVSCQPPTLARDLKMLHRFYQIDEVTFVDLFPQTAHIETVVQLSARPQPLPAPARPERVREDRGAKAGRTGDRRMGSESTKRLGDYRGDSKHRGQKSDPSDRKRPKRGPVGRQTTDNKPRAAEDRNRKKNQRTPSDDPWANARVRSRRHRDDE